MNLVFLHGLAGDPEDIVPVARRIPGVRIHAPRVDYLHGVFDSLETLAAQILLDVPRNFLQQGFLAAGNSLGALLALAMSPAAHRSVLIAPHVSTTFRFMGRGREVFRRELARIFHDPATLSPSMTARYEARWKEVTGSRTTFSRLRTLKRVIESFDSAPWYGKWQHRLSMVCGRNDLVSPVRELAGLKRRYPGMRFRVLPECGHAIPLERPGLLARELQGEWARTLALQPDHVYGGMALRKGPHGAESLDRGAIEA